MTVGEIAKMVNGIVEGDPTAEIKGVSSITNAQPGTITFLSQPRYAPYAENTAATAIVVGRDWKGKCKCSIVRVDNPDIAFTKIVSMFSPPPPPVSRSIHPAAIIGKDTKLGHNVSIGPYTIIEDCVEIGDNTIIYGGCYIGYKVKIGADCIIYPHVSIREYCKIGDRVIIHNGTVIGSDGFGYTKSGDRWIKIPQVGIVTIGNDVEIGANVTIDRARFGETIIGNGVKIDNLVQVAHNVIIGDNTAIAAQTGIAGSTELGRNVQCGGQSGISGHLKVGNGAIIGAQAGVTKNVPDGEFVSGYPALPHNKAKKIHAHIMQLPELKQRIEQIEAKLNVMFPNSKTKENLKSVDSDAPPGQK